MTQNAKPLPATPDLLLRLLAGTATPADCVAAAHALGVARELFVIASTTREQDAESRARVSGDDKALARATARVESMREASIVCFNRATGLA